MSALELLREPSAPPPPVPDWLPSREELLERPLEFGIAIDPPGSIELDDSVYAEVLDEDDNLFLYKVHIADGGLLAGTPHLDTARERGWSEYFRDGTADYMLPEEVIYHLSLGKEVDDEGQPAITISFIAGEGEPPQDFDIYKSRLICNAMTYGLYAKRVGQHFNPRSPKSFDLEATIFRAAQYLKSFGDEPVAPDTEDIDKGERIKCSVNDAYDANSFYMRAANIGFARKSFEDGTPHLYRVHHIGQFDFPGGNSIRKLYPNSDLFAAHKIAWYSRIPSRHDALNEPVFAHATSPLRRSPDLFNHVNRSAVLEQEEPPFDDKFMDEFAANLAEKVIHYRGLGQNALTGARILA